VTRAAVVGGDLTSEKFAPYAKSLTRSAVHKGVRQVLHPLPKGTCLSRMFVENVKLLGKLGLRFDLCIRPGELTDGLKLVEQCPEVRFIVDHCGNADVNAWLPEKRRGKDTPAGRQEKRDLQDQRHCRPRAKGMVKRGPGADRQSLPRQLRARPGDFWQRLAGLPAGCDLPPVGDFPPGDHRLAPFG
jgi:hypothetical protein